MKRPRKNGKMRMNKVRKNNDFANIPEIIPVNDLYMVLEKCIFVRWNSKIRRFN
jgi:hypothetical protein